YEMNGKRHHHHFVCRVCGRVFDIEGCPGQIEAMTPKGFLVEDHEIFLYGRCEECR
ncbi:MAG: transcriptional repressor, partial [Candidatus Omnitrophica bacterium]|nr:transcriptional repressor [Candidatus Omnitrophota bacterium]